MALLTFGDDGGWIGVAIKFRAAERPAIDEGKHGGNGWDEGKEK
jgi:hypothetical protein